MRQRHLCTENVPLDTASEYECTRASHAKFAAARVFPCPRCAHAGSEHSGSFRSKSNEESVVDALCRHAPSPVMLAPHTSIVFRAEY